MLTTLTTLTEDAAASEEYLKEFRWGVVQVARNRGYGMTVKQLAKDSGKRRPRTCPRGEPHVIDDSTKCARGDFDPHFLADTGT